MLKRIVLSILSVHLHFLLQGQNALPENVADRQFADGLELHQKEQFLASRAVFESFIRENPSHSLAVQAKYYVAVNAISGNQKDAEYLMDSFVSNYPDHQKASTAYFDLGSYYFDQGSYRKSAEYFEKVALENLDFELSQEGRFKLGYCHFTFKEYESAINLFEQVAEIRNPYYEDANYYLGYIYYEQGIYEIAIPHFTEAEKSSRYQTSVPPLIANAYLEAQQYENLIAYAERLGSSKLDPKVQLLIAEAYYYLEDYFQATKLYELAISENRKYAPSVYFHQGYANYRMGSTTPAVNALKKAALSSEAVGQYSSYYLGLIYTRDEEEEYALNAFEKAANSNYNQEIREESTFRVGQLNYDLGRYADAIDQLSEFIKRYPNSSFRSQANDLLSNAFLLTSNYDLAINYIEGLSQKSEFVNTIYQQVAFLKGSQLFNDRQFAPAIKYFDKSLSVPLQEEYVTSSHYWKGEAYSIGEKWVEAINAYSRVVFNRSYLNSPLYVKSRYGLAYAYYNTKVYDRAKIQFAEYAKALNGAFDQPNYLDALVRLGDCYFVEKKYQEAINNYEKALQGRSKDRAYIYLQLGLAHGFNNNLSTARESFQTVLRDYPQTRIAERSAYQWGLMDFENGFYTESVEEFSLLLSNYPESELVPSALVKRGVANFNLGKIAQSIEDYRRVLDDYTENSVANSALLGLQEAASSGDFGVNIDTYIAKYRLANPNDESLENIEFEAAKSRYFSQDYPGAIERFSLFNQNYPQSGLAGQATYFLADANHRLGKNDEALEFFHQALNYPLSPYFNRCLLRIADIEFSQGNYMKAIMHYRWLGKEARNPKESYNSREGLMRSHDKLEQPDSVQWYARRILSGNQVSSNGYSKANLFLGKTAIDNGNFDEALSYLQETAGVANDENAAEATYLIGKVYHLQSRYDKSNETLFEMNTKFSIYEYWLGQSFLLIAENYFITEELFQAKATLNSIVEKSPVDEIRREAQRKLAVIEEKERQIIEETDTLRRDTSRINGNR